MLGRSDLFGSELGGEDTAAVVCGHSEFMGTRKALCREFKFDKERISRGECGPYL